jgi:2,3-bisphosphoglycerate-independent phosphoglycerate mutase
MISLKQLKEISFSSDSKIVMLVMDGLGGLSDPETGKTELETAFTPNLDLLARSSTCGLINPVSPGITPGSGAGHLALFGYDPLHFDIGRGVLEALGVDFELTNDDIPARGNFCTIDSKGIITDRRAGRIDSERCAELCKVLGQIKLNNAECIVRPVKEHRFLFVLRGKSLSSEINDTDPQKAGLAPLQCIAKEKSAQKTAELVNEFVSKAAELLSGYHPANMLLLRGFSCNPDIPSMNEIYKLKPAAIAVYPMYRGLARLVGMKIYRTDGGIKEELGVIRDCYKDHDFFFIHVKKTDSAGEDGDFIRKVKAIEEVDLALPQLMDLKPDVVIVTGDHSTPALLKGHSWHPVPFMLYSQWCRADKLGKFSEPACLSGGLGTFSALDIMPLAMANSLKLNKYGA